MLRYNNRLRPKARDLRKNMTDSENVLWSRLRRKQLLGVQFYRQKPIGNYVVDFLRLERDWSWKWTVHNTWKTP